jgi:hypothetical protein
MIPLEINRLQTLLFPWKCCGSNGQSRLPPTPSSLVYPGLEDHDHPKASLSSMNNWRLMLESLDRPEGFTLVFTSVLQTFASCAFRPRTANCEFEIRPAPKPPAATSPDVHFNRGVSRQATRLPVDRNSRCTLTSPLNMGRAPMLVVECSWVRDLLLRGSERRWAADGYENSHSFSVVPGHPPRIVHLPDPLPAFFNLQANASRSPSLDAWASENDRSSPSRSTAGWDHRSRRSRQKGGDISASSKRRWRATTERVPGQCCSRSG